MIRMDDKRTLEQWSDGGEGVKKLRGNAMLVKEIRNVQSPIVEGKGNFSVFRNR